MTTPAATGRLSSWRIRAQGALVALFTQGISPGKVALTLAVGTACSLFPFLGFTSLLNLGVGLWLRMNQPILQALNQLLGPLQLVLIIVYVRLGEWLWQAQDDRFTITEMLRTFREASLGDFLQRFGWAGIHAFTAWALTSPLLIAVLYYAVRPSLLRLASKAPAQP